MERRKETDMKEAEQFHISQIIPLGRNQIILIEECKGSSCVLHRPHAHRATAKSSNRSSQETGSQKPGEKGIQMSRQRTFAPVSIKMAIQDMFNRYNIRATYMPEREEDYVGELKENLTPEECWELLNKELEKYWSSRRQSVVR